MKPLPRLTVGIATYNRQEELQRTFNALQHRLHYDAFLDQYEKAQYVISDDSSPSPSTFTLEDISFEKRPDINLVSTPRNMGLGANFNNLIRNVNWDVSPIALIMEDDWELTRPHDISPYVALLLADPTIGCVKIRCSAGLDMHYRQCTTNIGDYLPDFREGMNSPGAMTYLEFMSSSPSLYIWSNGINLVHKRWFDYYGEWVEGLPIGECEHAYCHRVKDNMDKPGAPRIVTHWSLLAAPFQHIGYESWQGREQGR